MNYDLCIIGGFGHIGFPLALAFASRGLNVCALDIVEENLAAIASGKPPFLEHGAEEMLRSALDKGNLHLSLNPEVVRESSNVVIATGTPFDRHLNPEFDAIMQFLESYSGHFVDGQLIILRSTVFPGTTRKINEFFQEKGKDVEIAFCPERIAEGYALKELFEIPQIVSGFTEAGICRASALFRLLVDDIIVLEPLEAELAKLLTNAWRYLKFGIANQFFMIANDCGVDYYKIKKAVTYKYPRAEDIPMAGFTAGPCLFKDTVQLNAFSNYNFQLGNAALQVNEGLPSYIVSKLKHKFSLKDLTTGILGMAFKANNDDRRESLSYKLRKILELECRHVYCSDVYIKEPEFMTEKELIEKSDIIIIGSPHDKYRNLLFPGNKVIIDVWNIYGRGCVI